MLQSRPPMIRSMTGYGQGSFEAPGLKVTVEIRSVNNRFADLKLRLPDDLVPFEPELRRTVLGTVKRGRVELDLRIERLDRRGLTLSLNREVVESALAAWKILRDEYGLHGEWDIHSMMRVPGVLETARPEGGLDDVERDAVDRALASALSSLDAERRREGGVLRDDLLARIERMRTTTASIRTLASSVPATLHKRLVDRVGQLVTQVSLDPVRVAQEAAFLADRADITEEMVRLDGHLAQARTLLEDAGGDPVGKRLDFLVQEIHRETNTITSKSVDLEISRHALDLKADAEKIREQIQNLE